MAVDDPQKPEFASWRSYDEFARRVRHSRRFVWEKEVQAFLDTVLATRKGRDMRIAQGTILCRAQRGVDFSAELDKRGREIGGNWYGLGSDRMKPLANRAKEGRVNPMGIPVLYLASTQQTAVSEVRPWIGSEVSIAQFEILRNLKAVNLSVGHGKMSIGHMTFAHLLGEEAPDAKTKEKAVWIDIDNAFSRPVTLSDDTADYVPTQILAELFRHAGYDAIVYRSQFGKKGYNVALFDIADAEAINCAPYQVSEIEVKFKPIGNTWYSTKRPTSKKQSKKARR